MPRYRVYYMRPEAFPVFILGTKVPTRSELARTHVFLCEIEMPSLEGVYIAMQADSWSPNGKARPLIESKGLRHTSMSVGDVIEDEAGRFVAVSNLGFQELQP